ncbi:hypothetical protein [Crocosphaera sp. XPORK-15E]|uniref:hypothetical protein n=1 Tax=Crocosphaera sp. XPORK-15E TaxID=3110247 RepID=UPI002B21CC4A|nr:hypothetical protein [Crocosphaera sp. XPORK-15E]MEA5537006.1 hypothetical protein [Crocosphaera sp. XPORK-15E]
MKLKDLGTIIDLKGTKDQKSNRLRKFMKKLYSPVALGLSLSMTVGFGGEVSAQKSAEGNINITEPASGDPPQCKDSKYFIEEVDDEGIPVFDLKTGEPKQVLDNKQATESVKLYHLRRASNMVKIIASIAKANPCLQDTVIEPQNNNVIVLYGSEEQREELKRIITMLDLRLEGVNMAMWGILISSGNPHELTAAVRDVNKEINTTQRLLRKTYQEFEAGSRKDNPNNKLDQDFKRLFEVVLGYRKILDGNHVSRSMIDILLTINATADPTTRYNEAAQNICKLFFEKDKKGEYKPYIEAFQRQHGKDAIPFRNYIERGLHQKIDDTTQDCNKKFTNKEDILNINGRARKAILEFALHYSDLRDRPSEFNPQSLQESAAALNSVLQPIVDAINRDVEELFMEPTLARMQNIVGNYWDVSYAEVGRTTVAGLNGLPSEVTSTTVSAFDETGPLRLNELIKEAGEINSSTKDLLPNVNFRGTDVPIAGLVSAIAALGADRSLFRALTSGVSMKVTPSVLRNSASAELDIDLTTGPPGTEVERKVGAVRSELRPLSRITQNRVDTTVYVDTLDVFALSTFNSQTTIDGGRTYIPIVGTIWQGIFSGIPVVGDLFSWQNPPDNVRHQSIVLTNSFIVPTAMGLAGLYASEELTPTGIEFPRLTFRVRYQAVKNYLDSLERRINSGQPQQETNPSELQFPNQQYPSFPDQQF